MGLTALLGIAGNALAAQSYALDVVGNNTANVDTPGYVDEQVNLVDTPEGNGDFGGVNTAGVIRTVSQFTQAQVYAANGQASSATAEDGQLSTVQAQFNDLQGTGLGATISAVFSAFGTLSTNPDDATARNAVVSTAQQFVQNVSTTSGNLALQQQSILQTAQSIATQINGYSAQIATLNGQIQTAKAEQSDPSDLEDAQAAVVTNLSQLVNINTFTDGEGNLVVRASGTTLVQSATATALSVTTNASGNFTLLAGTGSGANDVTSQLTGGELGGLLNASEDISTVSGSLDQLTYEIANAVNTQQQAGFDTSGNPGQPLFEVAAPPGTAGTITVNAAIAGDPSLIAASASAADPDDGSNAAAISALQDQPIANGGTETAANSYADIVGSIGQMKSNSAQAVTTTGAAQTQAQSLLDSQSGVSLDQEMINMQTYQSAYQAASRLLNTVSTLLTDLMANVNP